MKQNGIAFYICVILLCASNYGCKKATWDLDEKPTRVIDVPDTIDFGHIHLGTTSLADTIIAIRNFGNEPLLISNITVDSMLYFHLYTDDSLPLSIQPNDSLLMGLYLFATLPQSYQASLKIESDKTGGNDVVVTRGVGYFESTDQSIIDVGSDQNFGIQDKDSLIRGVINVSNRGTRSFILNGVNVFPMDSRVSLHFLGGTLPISLPQNQSTSLEVIINSNTPGPFSYTFTFDSDAQVGDHSTSLSGFIEPVCSGTFADSRDGKIYRMVRIWNQCWMAENLDYEIPNSWCYLDSNDYCNIFGRLYHWHDLVDFSNPSNNSPSGIQGICPLGWHVPSLAEWNTLIGNFINRNSAFNALVSTGSWGFGVKFGGEAVKQTGDSVNTYDGLGAFGAFWTSSDETYSNFYAIKFDTWDNSVWTLIRGGAEWAFSCRCVRD